jgi:hypothetical protein
MNIWRREKAKLGDERVYTMRCIDPFENIVARILRTSPKDGFHMNKLHL